MKCRACRGEGIVPGPRACRSCNGTGLRAVTLATSCGCGATYDTRAWERLPLLGPMDDGDGGVLELRNCACGSTLAIPVERDELARSVA